MSDYDVVWNGRGPLPGMSGEGFVQRHGSYLTARADYAPKSLLSRKEMANAKHVIPADTGLGSRMLILEPAQQKVNCRNCGRKYRTRIAGQMRLCQDCRGGRRKAA